MKKTASRRGFTLLELSIVLVIIGLIVGGVLVGRDLIHAAEIRSVVSDIEKFNTSVYTFKEKYNCLPGDCDHATDFWGQWSDCGNSGTLDGTTCNGDGEGLISHFTAATDLDSYLFWQHLALAGLISGQYSGAAYYNGMHITNTLPTSKLRAIPYEIYYTANAFLPLSENRLYVAMFGFNEANNFGYNPLTPDEAYNIDSKMDDGKPGTGAVRMAGGPIATFNCTTSNNPSISVYNVAAYSGKLECNGLSFRLYAY